MMGFLGRKRRCEAIFGVKTAKYAPKGSVQAALLAISRVDEKAPEQSMIRKSGHRFSEKDHAQTKR
jgi:hypothetical protein